MRNDHKTPPSPMRCFPSIGKFLSPGMRFTIHSFHKAGEGGAGPVPGACPEAPVTGSQAEPWEVEIALPPSCFSHQHSQAPGQTLATLTSRNNILATDSRPGLQHRPHIALSHSSPNAPQLPWPWVGVASPCVPTASTAVPRLIPMESRVPVQPSCPQGQMGHQRPSQTLLFSREAV